jgi:hypothetical protein
MPAAAMQVLLADAERRDRPLDELLSLRLVEVPDVFALSRWVAPA